MAPSLLSLANPIRQATQAILPLDIGFIQWATINGTDPVLTQPMVSSPYVDPWSFVGWMTMFEWVNGQREVYSFEGDAAAYVIMSRPHEFAPFAADVQELPHNACTYMWAICIYVSALLLLGIFCIFVYATLARFQIDGRNLFQTNRLLGGVWIGRPFLFIRGMTAVLVLSTSPVAFNRYTNLAKLDFAPRPAWHVLLLAGEVSWITYVINDVFLPVTHPYSSLYAPVSSILTWLIVLSIEFATPYRASATIGRECTLVSFMRGVECASGVVTIGSFNRAIVLVGVAVGTVLVSYPLVLLVTVLVPRLRPKNEAPMNVMLPSTCEAYLCRHATDPTYLDAVACILSGTFPLRNALFDIKLWVVLKTKSVGRMLYAFPSATLDMQQVASDAEFRRNSMPKITAIRSNTYIRATAFVGFLYMVSGVVTSFLYLTVAKDSLANDFLWLGFNDTNTHSFLCNWFNSNLQHLNATLAMQINDPSYGEYATTNNATQASVFSSALYAIAIQDEVNTLPNVVQGIRAMDSCNLPWIATAYCYADFGQRWPMAYSTRRQQRCQAEIDNGAVYLEAILRNADWPSLSKCWGAALETAILSGIRGSNTGNAWITSVQSNSLSVEGEVKFWQAQKITRFTTQWQNYKKLGVTESFIVANAMGVDYPLTLKRSNSTFHVSAATSFKMYWSLATDLTQVMTNGSTLSGLSLLQNTPTYAYANTTLQSVMLQGKVALVPPLDPSLAVFASTIGPFGVVDLKRVSTPQSLRDLYRSMSQFIMTKLSSSDVIQQAFWSIYVLSFFTPQPQAWDTFSLWGGDINCGLNYGGSFSTPFQFFSSNGVCGNYLTDYTSPYTQNVLMAILASGSYNMNAKTQTAISNRDSTHHAAIATILNSSTGFLNQYFTQTELSRFQPTAQMVKSTIRDVVKLELFHYLSYDNVNYNLSRVNLFSPAEPDFEYFSWLYLF
ncbi:hypothetical protein As57867_017346, partial [Aphanomyces stellatus]